MEERELNSDPNIRSLEEESSKSDQRLVQTFDLGSNGDCICGWVVDTKEFRDKNETRRSSQAKEKENSRSTTPWKSYSPYKLRDQMEVDFLHFEDTSDYIKYYRDVKFKRQETVLREAVARAERHNRKVAPTENSSCANCTKCRNNGVTRVQNNGHYKHDMHMVQRDEAPLLVITSTRSGGSFQSGSLPLAGHFMGRKLQHRASSMPTRIFQSYKEQNWSKNGIETKVEVLPLGGNRCTQQEHPWNAKGAERQPLKHTDISPETSARLHCRRTFQSSPSRSKPSSVSEVEKCNAWVKNRQQDFENGGRHTLRGRSLRSSSAPQVLSTSRIREWGRGAVVSNKETAHSQGQGMHTIDYSQYTHMFKNVLDFYGPKRLQPKADGAEQQQTLLFVKS